MLSPPAPKGCSVVLLSPFEVHFSQTRIRAEFQDGHKLEETIQQIKAEEKNEDVAGDFVVLGVPFPRIEVTRWRCKLREADGSPKLDPATGLELYSHEERWFTFDNRRLCCLQRAASALWPVEARCEVVEIPPTLARMRELRKFDTRTFGYTVLVGRRDDPSAETWCWRTAVGVPEETQPVDGVARQRSTRGIRGSGRGVGESGGRPNRRGVNGSHENYDGESAGTEIVRNVLLFLLVYLGLRLTVSVFRHTLREMAHGAAT